MTWMSAALIVAGIAAAAAPQAAARGNACNMSLHPETRCPTPAYKWTNASSWEECSHNCCAEPNGTCLAFAYQPDGGVQPGPCHLKHFVTVLQSEAAGVTCGFLPGGFLPRPAPAPDPGPELQCPPQRPRPAPPPAPLSTTTKPHVFVFLQDDLGHDDVAFNGNEVNLDVTGNITAAARSGIILKRMYVHWHCSPTRRSFLSGRLPLHHSEFLSDVSTGDDIDLRWTTIAQKLKPAGYRTYWFGKGHTGYKSFNHLPLQLGFDQFSGFLSGAQSHFGGARWEGNCPWSNSSYSAEVYGDLARTALDAYDPTAAAAKPIFMYLPWQNVHSPYQAPIDWDGDVLRGMLAATDAALGGVVDTLKTKGMWSNSVVFYTADNGGTDRGSNWPLRGAKHSNWEGGMRAAAFVSGGLIPTSLRGSSSHVVAHIVDFYATICVLAGVLPADDSPTVPLPVDPSNPGKDIYENGAWPGVDGRDLWPALVIDPMPQNYTAVHSQLWLSTEVLIQGRYKLVVAQQEPIKTNNGPEDGWRCGGNGHPRCDTHNSTSCGGQMGCALWVRPTGSQCACGCAYDVEERNHFVPCLFDVEADSSEFHDLSAGQPALRASMWEALNLSNLEQYMMGIPGKKQAQGRTPPALLGPCNPTCAVEYWRRFGVKGDVGPNCGVPGCEAEVSTIH
eukprot:SAG31_NODE_1401_length_8497_cov_4.386640_2_plen_673_part_00